MKEDLEQQTNEFEFVKELDRETKEKIKRIHRIGVKSALKSLGLVLAFAGSAIYFFTQPKESAILGLGSSTLLYTLANTQLSTTTREKRRRLLNEPGIAKAYENYFDCRIY